MEISDNDFENILSNKKTYQEVMKQKKPTITLYSSPVTLQPSAVQSPQFSQIKY